jgi:hypothetical protein
MLDNRYGSLEAQLPEYAGCFFYLLHLILCYIPVRFFNLKISSL